jgi:hypothetical protein
MGSVIVWIWVGVVAAPWVAAVSLAERRRRATPVLAPATAVLRASPRGVVAIVPARDEAEIIEASVRALLAAPALDAVVVIDDRSTDDTPRILARLAAEDPRLRVLEGSGPAPGESGKCVALARAVAAISPPPRAWLFVDADVVVAPGAVDALLAAQGDAALVSVWPHVELVGPAERLVMPTILAWLAARYPAERVADPSSPLAFANGQLLLVDAEAYAAVGGHAALTREVLEDCALAARIKAAGGRLALFDARGAVRTRMYASWGELVEGWSKNLARLLGPGLARPLALAAASVVLGASGYALLGLGVAAGEPVAGAVGFAVVVGAQATVRARAGFSRVGALAAPLGAALAAYVLARSVALFRFRGRVRWKGREVGV